MPAHSLEDRAMGALMGGFIGDALALGPHWYYDLDRLHADYGAWINDYSTPKPGRYHADMKAGQLSQSGFLLRLTVQSLVDCGSYDEADFCRRMDTEFFPLLDGTPMNGPGGYTSQSIREAWRKRVGAGLPWGQVAGNADTTEAAERILAIAIRYAMQPAELALAITRNTLLTQTDGTVVAMTVAFGALLGMLVEGQPFDSSISGKLMARVNSGNCHSTRSPVAICKHRNQIRRKHQLPVVFLRRTPCLANPRLPSQRSIPIFVLSPPGRFLLCMACPVLSIISFQPLTILLPGFMMTSSLLCSMRSMVAVRIRPAPFWPAPLPELKPDSRGFLSASLVAWRIVASCWIWQGDWLNRLFTSQSLKLPITVSIVAVITA